MLLVRLKILREQVFLLSWVDTLFSVKCLLFIQKALRNMAKLTDDGKWLQENLNELIEDSPESDTKKEQKRLTDLLSKFSELQPNLNKVADKSTVFSKAYDFRDTLEKRNNWLDETQRLVNDEPSIDGLEDARAYLQEHEVIKHKSNYKDPSDVDNSSNGIVVKRRNAWGRDSCYKCITK